MFTGLVQDIAIIESVQRRDESSVMRVKTKLAGMMSIGDSISINGVCLTATSIHGDSITVDVMIQTLKLKPTQRKEWRWFIQSTTSTLN